MDEEEFQREIEEIRNRIWFLALSMFRRPISIEELPEIGDIVYDFEEFVFAGTEFKTKSKA